MPLPAIGEFPPDTHHTILSLRVFYSRTGNFQGPWQGINFEEVPFLWSHGSKIQKRMSIPVSLNIPSFISLTSHHSIEPTLFRDCEHLNPPSLSAVAAGLSSSLWSSDKSLMRPSQHNQVEQVATFINQLSTVKGAIQFM